MALLDSIVGPSPLGPGGWRPANDREGSPCESLGDGAHDVAQGARAPRPFGRLTSRARAMHDCFDVLERLARTDVTVMLTGETGSGKDLVAHALHDQSSRASGPFAVFDCGSVAPNLAESELLGHERGAFTGAVGRYAGAFERANGGTLFLDEVAELPLALQPRLLRALESRRVRRVGGSVDVKVDVRVIAATHRDLRAEVAAGRFREDLFFRLAVGLVEVPPLRARFEDLADLVESLLHDAGRGDLLVSGEALAKLRRHSWPGNVRELRNTLACTAAMLGPRVRILGPHHLENFRVRYDVDADAWSHTVSLAGHSLEAIEGEAVRQTLRRVSGNKVRAARMLGIALSTLYEKIRAHDIETSTCDQ